MKILVRDYLETLRERDELDSAIVNLLLAMDFRILEVPARGQPEHGLDIAALGSIGEEGPTLYLIQVKQGNITRRVWDTNSPNAVRPSLNELIDHKESFRRLAAPMEPRQIKVILAHNGYIDRNIKESYEGYVSDVRTRHQLTIANWNIDFLTDHFMTHMLREELFPAPAAQALRRLLAFIETPGYDFHHLRDLLFELFPPEKKLASNDAQRRFTQCICLAALVEHYAETDSNVGNLTQAIRAYELIFLHIFAWLHQRGELKLSPQMARLLGQYITCSLKLLRKLEPLLKIEDGLAVSGVTEVIEYPLRAFAFGGLAAQIFLFLLRFPKSESTQKELEFLARFLHQMLRMISGIQRPLFDHHMIEIGLLSMAFLVKREHDDAISYLDNIVRRLWFDTEHERPLPEATGNLDAAGHLWLTGQRHPDYFDSSSTLLTLLAELAAILDQPKLYDIIRNTWNQKVDFQQSYPTEELVSLNDSGKRERLEQFKAEHSIYLPESVSDFRAEIVARRIYDEPIQKACESIPLFDLACFISCRIERHRLPPFFWRQWLRSGHAESAEPA
jgi:hypothetical protein